MKLAELVVFLLLVSETLNMKIDEDGYPDVQDLFEVIPLPQVGRRSPKELNTINFDIERIDINKFKKKMEMFAMTLVDNVTDTRRIKIPYEYKGYVFRASRHAMRAKTLDLMLQIIYMARYEIQSLERSKYFSITDTGYRIAFIYRRLRRLWRQMMDIYTHLQKKIWPKDRPSAYTYYTGATEHILMAHLRVIKLHTDFLNLWWVLINLDGKYTMMLRATTTLKTRKPELNVTTPSRASVTPERDPSLQPTDGFLGGLRPTTMLTKPPLTGFTD